MELDTAMAFVRDHSKGVLTTIRRDGRPQLSNIMYKVGDDGLIRVSLTATRAKTKNLARDPRGSLYVGRDDFWAYVVIDGEVTMPPIAADPQDDTVEELIRLYREIRGEHSDWDDYRRAMVADHRTVVRLTPTHAYGYLS